jgi:hypothetical protein
MCNRHLPGLLTVLALLPAAPPAARAEDPAASPATPPGIGRELDEIRKELDGLRRDTARSFQAAQQRVDALAEQVARLRKEVDDLGKRQPPLTRSAGFPPAPSSAGTIRLINTYGEPVQIVVNGAAYGLAPGEVRLLRGQAPGRFTYEVSGIQPAVARLLAAGETFTIHVYPR